jgi:hypothetical protein
MKFSAIFKITTTRPLNALNQVSIAELAQFTEFEPAGFITAAQAADTALRSEWRFEYEPSDLEYLDFDGLCIFFKDGSSLTLVSR